MPQIKDTAQTTNLEHKIIRYYSCNYTGGYIHVDLISYTVAMVSAVNDSILNSHFILKTYGCERI